jgi:hypothetical protein
VEKCPWHEERGMNPLMRLFMFYTEFVVFRAGHIEKFWLDFLADPSTLWDHHLSEKVNEYEYLLSVGDLLVVKLIITPGLLHKDVRKSQLISLIWIFSSF